MWKLLHSALKVLIKISWHVTYIWDNCRKASLTIALSMISPSGWKMSIEELQLVKSSHRAMKFICQIIYLAFFIMHYWDMKKQRCNLGIFNKLFLLLALSYVSETVFTWKMNGHTSQVHITKIQTITIYNGFS